MKTILQIAEEEGIVHRNSAGRIMCYSFNPDELERYIARIRSDEREKILNGYDFFKTQEGQLLADAIRNSKE